MARLQDTTNQAKKAYDAKKRGDREEARHEAGTRALPADKPKTYADRRKAAVVSAMQKHKQLSPEELEKLKPSTAPLRDPDDTPSEHAKKVGRAQAEEATNG